MYGDPSRKKTALRMTYLGRYILTHKPDVLLNEFAPIFY